MDKERAVVTRTDGTITMKIIGNFDATTTPILNKYCKRIVQDTTVKGIVLDFQNVMHIDTSAFACMVGFMQEHLKEGTGLYLKNLNDEQKSHIEILKLSKVIKII